MKTHDMTKHVLNRIHYFENLQKQIDAHHTKASSITLRKAWLDNQKKSITLMNTIELEPRFHIM